MTLKSCDTPPQSHRAKLALLCRPFLSFATMNSLYNAALKQVNAIQRDLKKFETGEDTSVGFQGQISAVFNSLQRSIDDYDTLAKREMITAKRETAMARVSKFRDDYQQYKAEFDRLKKREENKVLQTQERSELFGRRISRNYSPIPEHPYSPQPTPLQAYQARERDFASSTDNFLDQIIAQGQNILGDLGDQNGMLKNAQRKMLDTANTLGLSQSVIRYIERRSAQDKWIFLAGSVITLGFIWAIIHYLT
ncbi:hypothetical protein BC938DRAFT_477626 [Jimgerdemannia flammicorona]|uniref:Protein transport protein BOS1 n=1 Tax=Jimgerdemannia flammicorona TaxID=994334 RepID=A0A433QP30_9FUNG|nr:hypothetical protein BC938DRAFT_477626 [Jimgerdemannia flammicorona]